MYLLFVFWFSCHHLIIWHSAIWAHRTTQFKYTWHLTLRQLHCHLWRSNFLSVVKTHLRYLFPIRSRVFGSFNFWSISFFLISSASLSDTCAFLRCDKSFSIIPPLPVNFSLLAYRILSRFAKVKQWINHCEIKLGDAFINYQGKPLKSFCAGSMGLFLSGS